MIFIQIFTFYFFLSVYVDAQRSPTISYISQEKVVNIGDTVELECIVKYTEDYPVVWLKTSPSNPSENVFISAGTLQITPGERYSVSYNEATGTYTLKVMNLQEIDAGLYECQIITGPGNNINANVWVNIRLPPVISDNSTRTVITTTNSTVELNCYASGYPEPRISWRRENNELFPTGGTMYIGKKFTIFNVTKDDRGTYYCIADNGVGKGARRTIRLEVELDAQRSPTISHISRDKVVNIGDTVELECIAKYTKDYPVVWLKTSPSNPSEKVFISAGTLQITPGERYSVSYNEATGTYTLKVMNLQEIDAGLYECQIITGPGNNINANVWVNIRLPPVISDNSTRTVITTTNSTVDLNCYASGYPEPRISWRRENNELLPTGGTMYIGKKFTIFNVTKDDRGTYYCIADNGVGKGARRTIRLEVELDAQRSPTISHISRDKVVNIGDTVELECIAKYTKDYPVVWLKTSPSNPSENVFISAGTLQIAPGERYSVSYNAATGTYTLKVMNLQEIDAGLYECQIITGPGSNIKANVWVNIRLPPVISDHSTRSVITSTNSTVDLNCYASGYPEPRISWRRENNELLPTGGTMYIGKKFTIFNVTKDDRGTYYCIADNGVGKGARRTIRLEVELPPIVTIIRPRYGQALQYDQILECHVEAFPTPFIHWYKDGLQLNNNQNYQISMYRYADEFTETTLRIITAEKHQYGFYTCTAVNMLGSSEEAIEFYETPNVICPPACGVNLNRSRNGNWRQSSLSWFL